MCGIYGRFDLTGPLTALDADHRAVRCLAHRGPDDEGVWHGGRAFIGMRRLSVIDLSTGHQPISNEDGTVWVVYNGEIYNYRPIRDELIALGHTFATSSDTEVIVHGYEEWGEGVLDRLNGMFAIALWDSREEMLWVARDRAGVKPVYYFEDSKRVVLGSEIKAILAHPDVPRDVHDRGLLNFLSYGHAVGAETIYRGVKKLLPGHLIRIKASGITIREWWDATPPDPTTMDEAACAKEVRRLLEDSVRLRLISDVPIGAFLSGGLDSSAVVAIMAQQMSRPVETFAIGFAADAGFNELPDARRMADHCRTSHHEMVVDARQMIGALDTLVYHFDEPFGDSAAFPTYLVSKLARQHVTVALTGEGGDELFGGYRRYWVARWLKLLRTAIGGPGVSLLGAAAGTLPRFRRVKKLIESAAPATAPRQYSSLLRVFSDDALRDLVDARLAAATEAYDAGAVYDTYFARASKADDRNKMMYVDFKTWMADTYLEKVDKTSMAVSLEARVPILDYRLIEFAMSIPSKYKISRDDTKHVFRESVKDLLPAATLKKPKHGFSVPTDPWFRGELKDYAFDVLMDPKTSQRGFVRRGAVEKIWADHQAGREVRDQHLWLLLNLELWARRFLDRRDLVE